MSYSTPPEGKEYAPWAENYVRRVPGGDIVEYLEEQGERVMALLGSISEEGSLYRYAPGKWSIREVLGHINDTERVFSYRALRIGRGDRTPLPGFEQDDYVAAGEADGTAWGALTAEFEAVRRATAALFRNLPAGAWERVGTAGGHAFSTRALAWATAGHVEHHLAILQERYLPGLR